MLLEFENVYVIVQYIATKPEWLTIKTFQSLDNNTVIRSRFHFDELASSLKDNQQFLVKHRIMQVKHSLWLPDQAACHYFLLSFLN